MNSTNTISVTEARRKIFQIADDVERTSAYYFLTDNGKSKAVLMSAEEFESWMETLDVLREMPGLREDIAEAKKEYKSGEYISLDALLKEEGHIVSDTSKKKYAVSGDRAKKGSKKIKKH